jgi:hypothetical protein
MKKHSKEYIAILTKEFPFNNCAVEMRLANFNDEPGESHFDWSFWVYPNESDAATGMDYCPFYLTVYRPKSFREIKIKLLDALRDYWLKK